MNPRIDFVREIDFNNIDSSALKRYGVNTEIAPGLRSNLSTGSSRSSLNIKFELPKSVQKHTFGWTPTVAIEIRGGK